MPGLNQLSSTAFGCLDRQLGEALDLSVSCRLLSERARAAGDRLTAVILERLSSELAEQATILAPLIRIPVAPPSPAAPEDSDSDADSWLEVLDARLSRAALIAETDAMSPGLEPTVVGLLSALAVLYRTRQELLLLSAVLDAG